MNVPTGQPDEQMTKHILTRAIVALEHSLETRRCIVLLCLQTDHATLALRIELSTIPGLEAAYTDSKGNE
jgi:hypothetical protein